jgi:acetyl esterase/lipase
MALVIDPQVRAANEPLTAAQTEPPPVGDVAARRVNTRKTLELVMASRPAVAGVDVREYSITTDDGATLALSWYHLPMALQGSATLYLHGGGMIFGLGELGPLYDSAVRGYVADSGVPMLVVDYRIAPEFPHPVPLEDCYAALRWLVRHADQLGVDPARVAVMGDSAGGGLAAGVCLLNRDRGGPAIAQQLLIYPMLDDRPRPPGPELRRFLTWSYDDNVTGWSALLGDAAGTEDVAPYPAPARATDLSGLPPTYIDVGDLDLFRREDVSYASRLADAGVPSARGIRASGTGGCVRMGSTNTSRPRVNSPATPTTHGPIRTSPANGLPTTWTSRWWVRVLVGCSPERGCASSASTVCA